MGKKAMMTAAAVVIGMLFLCGPVQAEPGGGMGWGDDGGGGPGLGADLIFLLSPSDNETVEYVAAGGNVTFSFSKITGAVKYTLNFKLYNPIKGTAFEMPVELTLPGTPGFSEQPVGMVYELALDSPAWNLLARHNIEWGVDAFDSTGFLIGSTSSKYKYSLKFLNGNDNTVTDSSDGIGHFAAFTPQAQVIQEIVSWGQKRGKEIQDGFRFKGDLTAWARTDLALYFKDFDNIDVALNQEIGSSGVTADIFMKIAGSKSIAVKLICETFPPGKAAMGDPDTWKAIAKAYNDMKSIETQAVRSLAMGIVVSNIAYDNAKYNLCDISLFDLVQLYESKAGAKVHLFFRWL